MTTRCTALHDDLMAYRDDELSPVRRLAVRWHLLRCAACREELNFMKTVSDELRASEPPGIDPDLRAKLLENIPDSALSNGAARKPPAIHRRPIWPALLGSAGIVCVVAAIIFPYFGRARENARRSSSKSELKQLGLAKNQISDYDEKFSSSATGGPVMAQAPRARSGGSINGGLTVDKTATEPARHNLDGSNYSYADGHVKWKKPIRSNQIPASSSVSTFSTGDTVASPNANDSLPSSLRMVHKEGKLAVEVKGLEDQSDQANQIIVAAGGYVLNNNLTTDAAGRKTANFTVRVLVDKFDAVLARLGKLGEVKEKSVTGEDITDRTTDAQQSFNVYFNDMAVKEAELRKAEQRRRDTWELREELRQLRIQAAQSKARLENLKRLGAMANLSLELREKTAAPKQGGFLSNIGDTTQDAYGTFLLAARVPVNIVLWLLAYSPLWLPVVAILWWWSKVYGKQTT